LFDEDRDPDERVRDDDWHANRDDDRAATSMELDATDGLGQRRDWYWTLVDGRAGRRHEHPGCGLAAFDQRHSTRGYRPLALLVRGSNGVRVEQPAVTAAFRGRQPCPPDETAARPARCRPLDATSSPVVRASRAMPATHVTRINPFEVSADADQRFLAGWSRAREGIARQLGCLGTHLHRSPAAQADFSFVNVARWWSRLAISNAVQRPEFEGAAEAMTFPSRPSLYQVIRG
jgi:quinol monooxygenase YgiN